MNRCLKLLAVSWMLLAAFDATAGYYTCGTSTTQYSNISSCPDGSIPIFHADSIDPVTSSTGTSTTGSTTGSSTNTSTTPSTTSGPITVTSSLGFDDTPVSAFGNSPATKTITVSVTDYVAFTASPSVTAGASDFGISGTTCQKDIILIPPATCTVTVYFYPETAGSKTGSISLQMQISDSTRKSYSFSVPVTGNGVTYETDTSKCNSSPSYYATESSGTVAAKSLSVSLRLAHCDIYKTGAVYVWAFVPGVGIATRDSVGNWYLYDGRSAPATYQTGTLLNNSVSVVQGADLSGLVGTAVYVGYGIGSDPLSSMLSGGTYQLVYTVASKPVEAGMVGNWSIYIPALTYINSSGSLVTAPASSFGTLSINADGSYRWVRSSGTYTGKLLQYRATKSASDNLWAYLSDDHSTYYLSYSSGGSMTLYDTATELYAFDGSKQ